MGQRTKGGDGKGEGEREKRKKNPVFILKEGKKLVWGFLCPQRNCKKKVYK